MTKAEQMDAAEQMRRDAAKREANGQKPEMVQHPSHYGGDTTYEHVKVALAWGLDTDAFLYNATKYIARLGKKRGAAVLEDLKKARWYLEQRIRQEEERQRPPKKEATCLELGCDNNAGQHHVCCQHFGR